MTEDLSTDPWVATIQKLTIEKEKPRFAAGASIEV
jgi:hypothetical protein